MTSAAASNEKVAKMDMGMSGSVMSLSSAMYDETPAPMRAICKSTDLNSTYLTTHHGVEAESTVAEDGRIEF